MPDEDPQTVIAVLEFVDSHPGITQSAVREALGLGWYEAGRALRHLVSTGLLEAEGSGREQAFYTTKDVDVKEVDVTQASR